MKTGCVVVSGFLCMMTALTACAGASGFDFRVGLSYISGIQGITDFYEDEFEAASTPISGVGLQFNTHYNWSHGSRADFTLGPVAVIIGDVEYYDVPLSFTYGFNFPLSEAIWLYGRAGVAFHIVGGDLDPKADPGVVGYVGMDFLRNKRVGFGFEVGYDSSTVTFTREDFSYWSWEPEKAEEELPASEVIVSVFARF
jgi:hypothetical protein